MTGSSKMKKSEQKELYRQIFKPFVDFPKIRETCTKCGHGSFYVMGSVNIDRIPDKLDLKCRKCKFLKRLEEQGWVFG